MDSFTSALLILAINTLITYFLLKQQDTRLAQQTNRDQVRFQRLHEKRVESLETLHKLLTEFSQILSKMHTHALVSKGSNQISDRKVTKELRMEAAKKHGEMHSHFGSVRLYLPDYTNSEIGNILHQCFEVQGLMEMTILQTNWDEDLDVELVKKMTSSFAAKNAISVPTDARALLNLLSLEMFFQTNILATIYKTIADSDYK